MDLVKEKTTGFFSWFCNFSIFQRRHPHIVFKESGKGTDAGITYFLADDLNGIFRIGQVGFCLIDSYHGDIVAERKIQEIFGNIIKEGFAHCKMSGQIFNGNLIFYILFDIAADIRYKTVIQLMLKRRSNLKM